jgi:hypothetical protein
MRDAIDSFPTSDTYVANPISDKMYNLGATDTIDLTNVFANQSGATPITKTIESVSDGSVISGSISGEILTLNASSFNPGTAVITIKGTATNDSIGYEQFSVTVTNPADGTIEDFEDGNFSAPAYNWTLTNSGAGTKNWSVGTNTPYEGTYCAVSADNRDSQTCAFETTVNYPNDGIITFWKKVSSEANYDFLTFYINGNAQGSWAGEIAWSRESFNVPAGSNVFKFEYSKDEAVTSGSDLAWVDYITFVTSSTPVTPPATTLVSPTDASTIATSTPTFDWEDVSGATQYEILVDNNSDFSSPEINTTVAVSEYTVAAKALTDGTYYWKTKVTNNGPYSSTWSTTVSTGGSTVPAVPANLTTSIVSGDVFINWDDSADATSYDIYTSADPYGSFGLLTNVTASEYTYTGTEAKMFFYIVAKNSTKESPKSVIIKK